MVRSVLHYLKDVMHHLMTLKRFRDRKFVGPQINCLRLMLLVSMLNNVVHCAPGLRQCSRALMSLQLAQQQGKGQGKGKGKGKATSWRILCICYRHQRQQIHQTSDVQL